jgi:hypothetical protein
MEQPAVDDVTREGDEDPDDGSNHTNHTYKWTQGTQPTWENNRAERSSQSHNHTLTIGNSTLGSLEAPSETVGAFPSSSGDVKDENVTVGQEAFVKVRADEDEDGSTSIEVEVASVNTIVSIYMLMYIPLGMGWMMYFQSGQLESTYMMLLPLTLCLMMIGLDLVNQSLAAMMASPMAITSIQAFSMVVLTGGWIFVQELRAPVRSWSLVRPLAMWLLVAFMFTWFQVVNHLVSYLCSLSERTVFLNLCPVVSMFVERTLYPQHLKVEYSFNAKMALSSMVFGAAIFGIQFPQFSRSGVAAACLLIVAVVPYRLVQRRLLSVCTEVPIPWLACFDAIVLLPSSTWMSVVHHRKYWQFWDMWLNDSSISLMIILSLLAFTGNHVCTLLLLKVNTATTTMVFQNLACFVEVGCGILFFGDQVLGNPLVFAGLSICLLGGFWYAIEVQRLPPKAQAIKAGSTGA